MTEFHAFPLACAIAGAFAILRGLWLAAGGCVGSRSFCAPYPWLALGLLAEGGLVWWF